VTPSLGLFAQIRRYRLAVVAAAETAADLAVVMKTNLPAGGEAASVEQMAEMELVPRMAVFGPEGWEPTQIKAEQPATTFTEFCNGMIAEAARPFNMPKNVALCDSSAYNYASGRLDHQTYFKSINVEHADCDVIVLDRILAAWLAEYVRVFPQSQEIPAIPSHQWFWPGREHVDPLKEASAQATRLASNTTTLAAEYAGQGKDWETELNQRAKEVKLMKELGLPLPAGKSGGSPDAEAIAEAVVEEMEEIKR
jgi:hypothetical protein